MIPWCNDCLPSPKKLKLEFNPKAVRLALRTEREKRGVKVSQSKLP